MEKNSWKPFFVFGKFYLRSRGINWTKTFFQSKVHLPFERPSPTFILNQRKGTFFTSNLLDVFVWLFLQLKILKGDRNKWKSFLSNTLTCLVLMKTGRKKTAEDKRTKVVSQKFFFLYSLQRKKNYFLCNGCLPDGTWLYLRLPFQSIEKTLQTFFSIFKIGKKMFSLLLRIKLTPKKLFSRAWGVFLHFVWNPDRLNIHQI